MKITIFGSNGMLSQTLTEAFMKDKEDVVVYGLDDPKDYCCSIFKKCNLLTDSLDYDELLKSDIIIYAAGAGVQAAQATPAHLMYSLNVQTPIQITLNLKLRNYKGVFISFGSYMEIGLNDIEGREFLENEVICSDLPVTNDYALSKRLFSRYIKDFKAGYTYWHFILPNMFSYNDKKPGSRLIPYVLQYCRDFKANKSPEPPEFSDGNQTRQYIFLEEIPIILKKSIRYRIPSGIYNVGGGEFKSIRQTIESIFKEYGVPCQNSFFGKSIRRDGDIKSLRLNGSKLKKSINYLPYKKMTDILCD